MVFWRVIDFGKLVKVTRKRGARLGVDVCGVRYGSDGFCGPCVCLGVFLLQWRIVVSGIAGDCGCVQLVQEASQSVVGV
jgi:hypothetical protein